MKVAILAYLSSFNPSYSIANVVLSQLKLLAKHTKLTFITTSDFKDQDLVPKGVRIEYIERYSGKQDDILELQEYSFKTSSVLRNLLKDQDTCIQHDLLFIHDFLPMNLTIRETGKLLPKLKWLHWQHSGPRTPPKDLEYPMTEFYRGMDNSKFVYLNRTDIPEVAKMLSIPENQVVVVNNFLDLESLLRLHPLTVEILEKYNLLDYDHICTYPTRLTEAKQPHMVIDLIDEMNKLKPSILIICNSWSNAEKEQTYLSELQERSTQVIFTSEIESNWAKENNYDLKLGVPHEVVQDLMRLSDLFILPSISECCSLIMLEAAINKCAVVLNDDLKSLKEFGGQTLNLSAERCLYISFGSITRPITGFSPDYNTWLTDKSIQVLDFIKNNPSIEFFRFVRQRHSSNWVWKNHLQPLL